MPLVFWGTSVRAGGSRAVWLQTQLQARDLGRAIERRVLICKWGDGGPLDAHILIPRTWGYVHLQAKRTADTGGVVP